VKQSYFLHFRMHITKNLYLIDYYVLRVFVDLDQPFTSASTIIIAASDICFSF